MKKILLFTASYLFSLLSSFAQTTFTHAECGAEFTVAVKSDSSLWACGFNGNGQLGDSIVGNSDTLLPVLPGQKWIYAATGAAHTLAIAADSTLWGWGLNGNGQLGTGTTSNLQAPTQVNGVQHWRYVSAGEAHTIAILNDGTLWAAGYNYLGQLGTGDTTGRLSFVQIGTDNTWKTVSAGGVFTLAIKQDGTLWGWGYNGDGELGMGNTSNTYLSPTQIGTDTNWAMVSGGFEFSLAMKSDGTIWSTGFNGNRQLGRTTTGNNDSVFQQASNANSWKYIAAGASFGFAIAQNGALWGWGYNSAGQLGIAATSAAAPTQVGTDTSWQYITAADGLISGSSVYGLHSAGFKTIASGLCTTGADYEGQLGNGEIIGGSSGQYAFDCSVGDTSYTTIVTNIVHPESILVYPNPAGDELHIDGVATTANFLIYNITGSIAQKGSLQKGTNSLSVQALVPGVYIVTITSEEGERSVMRLIKN